MSQRLIRTLLLSTPSLIVAGFCTALLSPGCAKEEPVQYPTATQTAYYPTYPATATYTGAPTGTATYGTPPPTATQTGVPAGGGTVADPVVTQALDASIVSRAASEFKGSKPIGEAFGSMLPEGGQASQIFMIQPNKCYSVVAEGGLGVADVDVQITGAMGQMPLPAMVFAVDNVIGSQTSITPCWKNPTVLAGPAAAVVVVKRGSGIVRARVFEK